MAEKLIKVLDSDTINKIAAGEVIERPASVVKELTDNAIDAGAANIRIELKDAGKSAIIVRDDGKGMSREDATLCTFKHATSKITTADDLESVRTMGFRGEALASVSAVSAFEIITKRKEDPVGTHLEASGGRINVADIGAPDGTAVFVKDLFCSTPVRKKYLKSDATELSHIVKTVGELILANESLTITLQNNGRKILSSPSSTLLDAVSDVMGAEAARAMIPLPEDEGSSDIKIDGYVSKPEFNRKTPEQIVFIVNGRPVSSKELIRAVRLGYYTKIPGGRYPAAVIRISMPPEAVDVNVHPRKTEVRFADEKSLSKELIGRIEEALRRADLSTHVTTEKAAKIIGRSFADFTASDRKTETGGKERTGEAEKTRLTETIPKDVQKTVPKGAAAASFEKESEAGRTFEYPAKTAPETENSKNRPEEKTESAPEVKTEIVPEAEKEESAPETEKEKKADRYGYAEKTEYIGTGESGVRVLSDVPIQRDGREKYDGRYVAPAADTEKRIVRSARLLADRKACAAADTSVLDGIRIIGQISVLYILAETADNGLLIIDQHAAHERIFYDLFGKTTEKQTQELISPVVLRLTPREKVLIEEYIPALEEIGFGVSEFGDNDFVVTFVPLVFGQTADAATVKDLINDLFENGSMKTIKDAKELILKRMACRAAIKSGAACTPEQMRAVVEQLKKTDHPYSCPHGRPTIVTFSEKEIEKLFERI